jgi:mono/diheme cytochrome c family protein
MRHLLSALAISFIGIAQSTSAEVDFVRDVRPIFQTHCYGCHAEESQKSGLRLDIKSEAFRGGDGYGPSVIAGEPDESPLIQMVSGDDEDMRMPPDGDGLSAEEIKTLTDWVAQGASWPDGVDTAKLVDKRDHWAFKPVTAPEIPDSGDDEWPRHGIDRFILARLHQSGLRPAPAADPAAWLRRVSFDLTGLPPTPEQVSDFLLQVGSSESPEIAYENVVDRLLDSPRYGERAAQAWLDLVRYADTHGFEVNTERPNAWPYRDYVIDAFNRDTPYDEFVRQQIVGDAIGHDAATGFLVTASVLLPGQIGQDDASKRLARQDAIDEIVVNIGQTFLGLSVGCARCHDHKFDPISHRDYYAMQAFVAGVEYEERELRTPESERRRAEAAQLRERLAKVEHELARLAPLARPEANPDATATSAATAPAVPKRPAINPRMNTDRFVPVAAKRLRFTIHATNNLEPCIDELEVFDTAARNVALATAGPSVTSSGDIIAPGTHDLLYLNDGRYGNSSSWMSHEMGRGSVTLEFPDEVMVERVVWGRDRMGVYADRLATDYRIEVAPAAAPDAWVTVADSSDRAPFVTDDAQPPALSTEGLSDDEKALAAALATEKQSLESQLAAAVESVKAFAGIFRAPDVIRLLHRGDPEQPKEEIAPAVLSVFGDFGLPGDAAEQERRLVLADWIANPDHPLTSRVMVNRIWQSHFGTGLVETASDFGRSGSAPSHPELLDWLATEFVRSGWSVKQMHRMIVLSSTYRQSTLYDEAAAAIDADVRLLWRYPPRRLDAESIRDSMLITSDQLNLTMGGPGFNLFDQRGGLSGFKPVESFTGDGLRRLIYAHKVRRERDAVFGAFDCPDGGQSTARRRESTTPIQALNLFNSLFTLEQSDALARRVLAQTGEDVDAQIRQAYRLTLGRDPRTEELAEATPIVQSHGLSTLARVLFNSNEFLFLP